MNHKRLIPLFATLLLPLVALASFQRAGKAEVEFKATGPAGLKIEGHTARLAVGGDDNNVEIKVDLASLETGIGLRDEHLRDKYLEVKKYPYATLQVPRASLKLASSGSEVQGATKGQLTLHGVTKPVSVKYTTSRNGSGYAVEGTMHIDIRDFKIEVPSYLGVTVKPDVDIQVAFGASGS